MRKYFLVVICILFIPSLGQSQCTQYLDSVVYSQDVVFSAKEFYIHIFLNNRKPIAFIFSSDYYLGESGMIMIYKGGHCVCKKNMLICTNTASTLLPPPDVFYFRWNKRKRVLQNLKDGLFKRGEKFAWKETISCP